MDAALLALYLYKRLLHLERAIGDLRGKGGYIDRGDRHVHITAIEQ